MKNQIKINQKFGWKQKILTIDLNLKNSEIIVPSFDTIQQYIGGRGLAGYYLHDVIKNEWNSEEMIITFFNGPLSGTSSPSSGLFTIMSKSPLTGTIFDCSTGGDLGIQLKKAGYDGLIIRGKSKKLCGIEIIDDRVSVIDADELYNKSGKAIFNKIRSKGSVVYTSIAADNGVLFSGIISDGKYFAARGGLGAVMSWKNLKYISVKGSSEIKVADEIQFSKAKEDIERLVSASSFLMGEMGISHWGSGTLYDLIHERKMMPTRNFRSTQFEAGAKMGASFYEKRYKPFSYGCSQCNIKCKRQSSFGTIPEYETMAHFSAMLNISDINFVLKANTIATYYGMDPISLGGTLATFMELNESELSSDELLDLMHKTGENNGEIGSLLGKGAFRLSEHFKHPEIAMCVKKLELPGYDPRGAYGLSLAYATSTKGGCHSRAYPISYEILRKPVAMDRFSFSAKARIIKISEDMLGVVDSLVVCKNIMLAATLEEYSQILSAVTGMDFTYQDLYNVGERILYNEWIMNSYNGFTAEDHDLPERFFTKDGTSGESVKIPKLNRQKFIKERDNYFKIRDVDKMGLPTQKSVEKLGLKWMN